MWAIIPALSALAATSSLLPTAAAQKVGYTSYANLYYDPAQVIDNEWFKGATKAHGTMEAWSGDFMGKAPWTVVHKELLPASGNTHDYYSLSVYWWPNCSKVGNTTELTDQEISNQCQYYQRDGVFNPDTFLVQDHKSYDDLTDSVYLASLAYMATGNATYATHVNTVIKEWFIDEATYMTPHLNYSQVRRGPGKEQGTSFGILDGKGLTKLVSAVRVMRESKAAEWEQGTDEGLVSWAREMAGWLRDSEQGQGERSAANNHGTFYFNQLCSLYVLLNDPTSAQTELEFFYAHTLPGQISANGSQPLEAARTRPYHYTAYNLAALITNAQIGDTVNLSPSGWNRTSQDGATLFDALDYAITLDPAASGEEGAEAELGPSVAIVAAKFGDPEGKYAEFLQRADRNYDAQPYYALAQGLPVAENDYGTGENGASGVSAVGGGGMVVMAVGVGVIMTLMAI